MKRVRTVLAAGRGEERGVTLIEMMIALAILGIVIGPIAAAIVVGLRTTGGSSKRLNESHDRQLVEVYFLRDISSAKAPAFTQVVGACRTGVQSVLVLKWTGVPSVSGTPATTQLHNYEADYVLENNQLVRYYCDNTTLTTRLILARNLTTSNPPVVASVSGSSVTLTLTDTSGVSYSVSGKGRT